MDNLPTIKTIVELLATALLIFNTFFTIKAKNVILELQLNLRREFNGRYQTLSSAQLEADRLKRLEDKVWK